MDKFVVFSMNDESKNIAKVLSNDTAISILNKLAEKRMSASEIVKELKLPVSTVQYNLDMLKEVKLINDTAYRYSEKGKKVLYYEPAKKLIILAPEKDKSTIINMLKNKFLIPIILGASAALGFAGQKLFSATSGVSMQAETALAGAPVAKGAAIQAAETVAAATCEVPITGVLQQPWFYFFLGALFATAILLIAYLVRKK